MTASDDMSLEQSLAAHTVGWSAERKADLLAYLKAQHTRESARLRYSHPAELAAAIDPAYRVTPAIGHISRAVERVLTEPRRNLLVTMPPQHGKSSLCAVWAPIRALQLNPDTRIILATYGDSLAEEHSANARGILQAHGTGSVDPITGKPLEDKLGMSLNESATKVSRWRVKGGRGGMLAVGIGSSVTGFACDCIAGDVYILTEYGHTTAEDAYNRGDCWIRAYDHDAGAACWRRVEARRRIERRRVVTVHTQAGRVLTCTPDHRIYTSRGYVAARDLRDGDALVSFGGGAGMSVRYTARDAGDGRAQGCTERPEVVLQPGVQHSGTRNGSAHDVVPVRGSGPPVTQGDMFPRLPDFAPAGQAPASSMSAVRDDVPASQPQVTVLQQGVRERRALGADAWDRELSLSDRDQLCEVVPFDAPADLATGQEPVRSVRAMPAADPVLPQRKVRRTVIPGDPSHQRGPGGQYRNEPHYSMSRLPYDASQVGADTVAWVEWDSREPQPVYDFQVEGTRNFFAGGLLVHNCMIIDDPFKNMQEADSAAYRRKVMDWFQSVALTRLSPNASIILVQTRWHADDLAGQILAAEHAAPRSERTWKHINIPAVAEEGVPDALNRKPGTALISARGHTPADFASIRKSVGERVWAALYQGMPTPVEGGLFARDWFSDHRLAALPDEPVATVIGIDPAETGEDDEAGIIAAALMPDSTIALTHDRSGHMTSDEWARAAIELALRTRAREVAFEAYATPTTYRRVLRETYTALRSEALARKRAGDTLSDQDARLVSSVAPPFKIKDWRGKGDAVARSALLRRDLEVGQTRVVASALAVLEEQAREWQVGQHQPDRVAAAIIAHDRARALTSSPGAGVAAPVGTGRNATGAGPSWIYATMG